MNLSIEDILRLTSFIPVLLYFGLRQEFTRAKQVLFWFFLFITFHSLAYASISYFLTSIYSKAFNAIYIPVEFFIVSIFYYEANKGNLYRKFIKYVSTLFILILSSRILIDPTIDFDSMINGVESVVIIFFSISYFYEQIKKPDTAFIDKDPFFWGISAFFLFFSVSFFVFLFRQYYWWLNDFYYQYVYIHALSGIARNLICSIAFLIKPYKEKPLEFSLKTNNEY